MQKTTVYLPDELKRRLADAARASRRSEAEVIRGALEAALPAQRPSPRLPLFDSGDPSWASRADEDLTGFGE